MSENMEEIRELLSQKAEIERQLRKLGHCRTNEQLKAGILEMTYADFDKIRAESWEEGWDAAAGWPQADENPYRKAF